MSTPATTAASSRKASAPNSSHSAGACPAPNSTSSPPNRTSGQPAHGRTACSTPKSATSTTCAPTRRSVPSPPPRGWPPCGWRSETDRKSTRLNSSHEWISYAVFCLKKKKKKKHKITKKKKKNKKKIHTEK